jgi:hypothetical protein
VSPVDSYKFCLNKLSQAAELSQYSNNAVLIWLDETIRDRFLVVDSKKDNILASNPSTDPEIFT